MSAVSAVDHYRDAFAAVEKDLPGRDLGWLRAARQEGLERFGALGLPTPRHEDWKYTNVRAIENRRFQPSPAQCVGLDPDDVAHLLVPGLDCHLLVFVNGIFVPQLSPVGRLPEGLRAASLARLLGEDPDALEPHLGRYADAGANGFAALSAAFLNDGACLRVSRGAVVEKPIQLLFLATAQSDPTFAAPRNLVVAEPDSQATVLETYACLGQEGAYLTSAVTEVVLQANARLTHYKLQQESVRAYHVATLQVHQQRDSRFVSHAVSLGAALARQDVNCGLEASGVSCTLNGLYLADGRQHVDFHTRVDHRQPRGSSDETYKGILGGRARGVFNGRVYVHPGAQKTDARQSNDNLLLSRHAEIDTKPQLEIFADDVACSHGATVGQLDADMLFYLRSRGIEENTARAMLTLGFARDVIDRMDLAPLRTHLERAVLARLPDADLALGTS